MILTLRVVALNDQPLSQPITARFDAAGGTLGRADHNTMALPDPERHISRQQAQVTAVGQGFVIRNVGSANPIVVGSLSLAQGESAPLRDGDALRIGGYLLSARVAPEEEGATVLRPAASTTRGAGAGASAGAMPADPFAGLGIASGPAMPFEDLLAPSPATGAAASHDPWAPVASHRTAPRSPAAPALPDDFDPFAAPALAVPAPARASASIDGAFADLIPGASRGDSLDDLFGLGAPSAHGADPLASFLAGGPVGAGPSDPAASTDPLAMFDAPADDAAARRTEGSATDGPAAWGDDVPALRSAFTPPVAREAAPALPMVAAPAPAPAVATASASASPSSTSSSSSPDVAAPSPTPSDESLWRAFCAGAGVRLPPGTRPTPELLGLVGQMLRTAVDGTVQLMALRATTKHELRADVTMIQSRNNNPLKFSPDGQAALEQLLQPPLRGFMPAPAAMADAMHDLVGHAIGTMAGTRAALEGVLGRFAPESLERQLATRSVLDPWLPGSRKARLWELYLHHYQALRDEAQEDFHALFGKAFVDAYEQQVEHLARDAAHRAAPAAGGSVAAAPR